MGILPYSGIFYLGLATIINITVQTLGSYALACLVRSWQHSFTFSVFRLVTNIVLLASPFLIVWAEMVRSLLGSSKSTVLQCWNSVEFVWRYGLHACYVEFFWRYGMLSASLSSRCVRVSRQYGHTSRPVQLRVQWSGFHCILCTGECTSPHCHTVGHH